MRWRARVRDPITLALAGVALALLAMTLLRGSTTAKPSRVIRFVLATPDSARAFDNFPWPAAISPDGSVLVYSAAGPAGSMMYALRTNQLDAQPIPGTNAAYQPLFSPDGEWLAFETAGKLRKVRLDGSAPITIANAGSANGADWTTTDQIVLGSESNRPGLSRVSAAGGELVEFAKPDKSKERPITSGRSRSPMGKRSYSRYGRAA